MLRLRLRKIGSWLGLLAILMTALAPTISQELARQHRLESLLATYCSVHTEADGQRSSPAHDTHADHSACGYCSLVAHTPVLVPTEASFADIVWGIQHRQATRFESQQRPLVLTVARPRAPPFSA